MFTSFLSHIRAHFKSLSASDILQYVRFTGIMCLSVCLFSGSNCIVFSILIVMDGLVDRNSLILLIVID